MAHHYFEDKEAFTLIGISTELVADYTDFEEINKQKAAFWQKVNEDGTVQKLIDESIDGHLFVINEAVDNKMMHSVGVQADHEIDGTVKVTDFPEGKYLIIEDKADDRQTLNDLLTYAAFGQVLNEITDYAYVGGPNAVVHMEIKEDQHLGQMWLPVVAQ